MCSAHTWRVFSTEFVSGINNRLTPRLKKKLSVNIKNAGRGNTMLHVTMLQVEILQCYMLQSGRNIQGEPEMYKFKRIFWYDSRNPLIDRASLTQESEFI